jgi:hypothetical protein
MRYKPFAFFQQVESIDPFIGNMLYWFKSASTNVISGSWTNSVAGSNLEGQLRSGSFLEGNAVRLSNTQSSTTTRNDNFRVIIPTGSTTIKSALFLFNQPVITGGGGVQRCYYYDARRTSGSVDADGGFFNQYDSVNTSSLSIHGNDATFYGYQDGGVPFNGGSITPLLLTNGFFNSTGGSGSLQWMGPGGRGTNTTKRVFFFNYNSSVPITLNSGTRGFIIGTRNDASEGSSMDLIEMIGYDRTLTFSEFEDVVTYLKSTGVIN